MLDAPDNLPPEDLIESLFKAHPYLLNASNCPDIPELADRWLKMLNEVGLPDVNQLQEEAPRQIALKFPLSASPQRDAYSAHLANGQKANTPSKASEV